MAAQMKLRAKYKVVGPQKVKHLVNRSYMDESKSLVQEQVEVEENMYMVYFPQGHSIRVNRKELVRLGFHMKPRLVDMLTGDVVDTGGDPYDLENEIVDHDDIQLIDVDDVQQEVSSSKSKKVDT